MSLALIQRNYLHVHALQRRESEVRYLILVREVLSRDLQNSILGTFKISRVQSSTVPLLREFSLHVHAYIEGIAIL